MLPHWTRDARAPCHPPHPAAVNIPDTAMQLKQQSGVGLRATQQSPFPVNVFLQVLNALLGTLMSLPCLKQKQPSSLPWMSCRAARGTACALLHEGRGSQKQACYKCRTGARG